MGSLWYTYKTTNEIIDEIHLLSDFSSYEFITLIFLLWVCLLLIYYVLPLISLSLEYLRKDKIILQKKRFIQTISLQRELEDEIAKEIQNENK